jgi:hypothetical protein
MRNPNQISDHAPTVQSLEDVLVAMQFAADLTDEEYLAIPRPHRAGGPDPGSLEQSHILTGGQLGRNGPRHDTWSVAAPVSAAELRAYPVVAEQGWVQVVKCQNCLHSVTREPWHRLGPIQLLADLV